MLRVPEMAIGELERAVLEVLWSSGALNPSQVHEQLAGHHTSSLNTVCSALKRLYEKQLLTRRKVSHAYVYEASVSRAQLQGMLIRAIAHELDDEQSLGFMAAFIDLAQQRGPETLRRLERMIAARLDASCEADEP